MKKNIFSSYIDGVRDNSHGESYRTIFRYFFPEFITAFVLYSALYLLDALFISELRSTSIYATLGLTNTVLHFIIKLAEAFSVGTIILSGGFNGAKRYKDVGHSLVTSFWLTFIVGVSLSSLLYFGAYWIYYFYGVTPKMIRLGVPFLRIRAIGIFFTFLYFAFIGFLRGIKNTKTPMKIFVVGAVLFLFFDYVLIFGKLGFPKLGLNGSACASAIQYFVMFILALLYLLFDRRNKKYSINLFSSIIKWSFIKKLLKLSWPVVIDKATMAGAYMWLGGLMAGMGKYALASFSIVKDMERFAFLPAVAFAQVVTLLVSNDLGANHWDGIKSNIKKVVFATSIMVFILLFIFSIFPEYIVSLFDKKGVFTALASQVFPILSVLVFLDVLQLILSGALRGAANVKVVMLTRLIIVLTIFLPVSYFISSLNINDQLIRFILIYGLFYLCSGIMSIVYIYHFRSNKWKS